MRLGATNVGHLGGKSADPLLSLTHSSSNKSASGPVVRVCFFIANKDAGLLISRSPINPFAIPKPYAPQRIWVLFFRLVTCAARDCTVR
jgi:hypothetical protein